MAFESSIEKVGIYKNGCVGEAQVPSNSRMQIPSGRNLQRILEILPIVQVKTIEKVQQNVSFKGEIEYTVTYADANNAIDTFVYVQEYEGNVDVLAESEIMLRAHVENVHTTFETNSEIGVEATVCVQAMGLMGETISVVTMQDEHCVQQTKEIQASKVSATGKDVFRVVGTYDIDSGIQSLVRANAQVVVEGVTSKTDMCTISGKTVHSILYVTEESVLQQAVLEVPFTQDVPCIGMREEQTLEVYAHVAHVVAKEHVKETEGTSIEIETEIEVQMCAYETATVEVVTDMYSTEKELELTTEACPLQTVEACAYVTENKTLEIEKEGAYKVLSAEITHVVPVSKNNADKTNAYKVEVGVRFVCQNEEGLYSVKNTTACVETTHELFENASAVIQCEGAVIGLKDAESIVRVPCVLSYTAQVVKNQIVTFVSHIEEKDDAVVDDCALCFYMAGPEQSLFDIAKQLHVKPEVLQEQNPEVQFEEKEAKVITSYQTKQISF